VPLHPAKQRLREFNQAARLARRLGQAIGLPVVDRLLVRTTDTPTQTRLTRADRLKNVKRAFALKPVHPPIQGRRIVLVDDVFTTGATTSACAQLLTRAQADSVCVWTVARGLMS